jgi:hypothetical protein
VLRSGRLHRRAHAAVERERRLRRPFRVAGGARAPRRERDAVRARPQLSHDRPLGADPFAEFELPPHAKRVVTFLRNPAQLPLELPIERDGASILRCSGAEVLSAYVPGPKGPVFMSLLERTFGTDITTRTLGTVRKCASA